MIDHLSEKADARRGISPYRRPRLGTSPEEYGLPRVRVPDPFVKDKRPEKVDPVFNLREQFVRQEVEDSDPFRVNGQARAEMNTGRHRLALRADREIHVGAFGDELRREFDERSFGHVDLQITKKGAGQPLVHQNAAMLRVIKELYNVECAVFGFDQMGLRSPPHLAD